MSTKHSKTCPNGGIGHARAPEGTSAPAAAFSRRKWMYDQFLAMIASGLAQKDGKFAKLQAFSWSQPIFLSRKSHAPIRPRCIDFVNAVATPR